MSFAEQLPTFIQMLKMKNKTQIYNSKWVVTEKKVVFLYIVCYMEIRNEEIRR